MLIVCTSIAIIIEPKF